LGFSYSRPRFVLGLLDSVEIRLYVSLRYPFGELFAGLSAPSSLIGIFTGIYFPRL